MESNNIIIIRNWTHVYAAPFAGGSNVVCACDPGGFRRT